VTDLEAGGPANGAEEVVRRVLATGQTWAVVGLRDNPMRPAYGVARFLQRHGKRIVPVHQHPQDVHGEKGYATLAEVPFPVDVVDVFVNSARAGAVADQAVAVGARAVWFQLGVVDEDAARRVAAAGLDMVMDRCPAIDWGRLGPAT
jgi:predicted CoA-binding protein